MKAVRFRTRFLHRRESVAWSLNQLDIEKEDRLKITDFIEEWVDSPFAHFHEPAWQATSRAPGLVSEALTALPAGYTVVDDVAIHHRAEVEGGSNIKGPAIIGPNAFVGAGALIRGGVFLGRDCIVGHACELKTSFMLSGSKVAHLSFVGDSVIGSRVNIEAGAVVANYRNELSDKRIRILWNEDVIDTGVDKFGALIGDDVRIGANSVVAPGAILAPGVVLPRLSSIDQYP